MRLLKQRISASWQPNTGAQCRAQASTAGSQIHGFLDNLLWSVIWGSRSFKELPDITAKLATFPFCYRKTPGSHTRFGCIAAAPTAGGHVIMQHSMDTH
jgi:hypothetical protein